MSVAPAPGWRRRVGLAWVESPGRTVVVDLDDLSTGPQVMEGSAAEIWHALARPTTFEDLLAGLAASYAVEPEEIRAECAAFLGDLERLGLVVSARPASGGRRAR